MPVFVSHIYNNCVPPLSSADPEDKLYNILYEDGDSEEIYEVQVKEILVKSSSDGSVGDKIKDDDPQGPTTTNLKKRKVRAPSQLPDMCKRSRPVDAAPKGSKQKISSHSKLPDARKSVTKRGLCEEYACGTKKYYCRHEGCSNNAVKGGVCIRHGAKVTRCREEGCTNRAQKGGVCIRHGAKRKRCREEGCTNAAVKGGICIRHGAKLKRCSHEGCTNKAISGGVCIRHGAKVKSCSHEGCTNNVVRGGVCVRHGAKVKSCSHKGCTNIVVQGGVCLRHGAKVKRG